MRINYILSSQEHVECRVNTQREGPLRNENFPSLEGQFSECAD